jgi:cytochrome c oxidase subunit 2
MPTRATFCLGIALVFLLGATQSPAQPQPQRRVVRVKAERFAFTPSEITLVTGETIELRIKSDDTSHGFRITGTDTDIAIPKRGQGETTVLFTGTTPGRYDFECNRMCGAGHDFMRGSIVVKDAPAGDAPR